MSTAIEYQYKQMEFRSRIDAATKRVNRILNKVHRKATLRVMTNYGPILHVATPLMINIYRR